MNPILPKQVDNDFAGHRAAIWILGLYVALKLVMCFNSVVFTEKIAEGADGIPLSSFSPDAARQVLMLFELTALGQLTLALVALVALLRYRTLLPFMYLLLLGEALVRRLLVLSYGVPSAGSLPLGFYVNLGLIALLAVGLLLSLVPARSDRRS
jgi:hypothetical protein